MNNTNNNNTKQSKYTEDEALEMVATYTNNPTKETVQQLAIQLDRSEKSIIGKLSREGVYRKQVYTTKTGESVITKLELVADIEQALEIEGLTGLEKAPKVVLQRVLKALVLEEKQHNICAST